MSIGDVCARCADARDVSQSTALAIWIVAIALVTAASVAAWKARPSSRRRAALTVVLVTSLLGAAVWLFVNGSVEIRPILRLTEGHGITAADLAALPFGAAALWAAMSLRSARRRSAGV